MKFGINIQKRVKLLCQLCAIYAVFLLAGCLPETNFSVQFPKNGELYVGDELVDFIVNYSKPVTTTDIYLNGVRVTDQFTFGTSSAVGQIQNIKKYIKQGTNRLTVDPLGFGPTVTFSADYAGPDIIVTLGKASGGTVELGGKLEDASGVSSLELRLVKVLGYDEQTGAVNRQTGAAISIPINADNTFYYPSLDVSSGVNIYSFKATDIHGYQSTKEYLADSSEVSSVAISNAMRMAIGDTLIESLRPVIASSLYTTLREKPIDIRHQCWDDPNKDDSPSQNPDGGFCSSGQDGSTFNPGLNPVSVDIGLGNMPTTIRRVYMDADSTVLLNKFKIEANERLDIDMVITELSVALTIDGGWLLGDIDMGMTIGRLVVDTGADVTAENKKVSVQLADSNFSMEDVTVTETTIWGMNVSGLVDAIMPLIEGMIGDMLPDILNPILNDNLQKIVIGARMWSPDLSTPYFDWALNVETIKTDHLSVNDADPYDMIVGLETYFDLLTEDPDVTPVLGPIYIEDPVDTGLIYNSLGATGTNLSFALSSNALNQAFAALYGSGLSHFNIVDGNVTYGADPTLPVGTDGQTRVRLYPDAPPFFTLKRLDGGVSGEAEASIEYESATLYFDKNVGGEWKEQLAVGVSFKIAASVVEEDNAAKIGISGSPEFTVNTVVNNTALPVTKSILQGLMDVITVYALPELSKQALVIDLNFLAQNGLNGTVVAYQSDEDTGDQRYSATIPCDGTETQCVNGYKHVCDTLGDPSAPLQSGYDLVCEEVNMVVTTSALTSIGDKGSNLFFQMEARDPNIPAAPAIPRFDLDNDGVEDHKDNCAVSTLLLLEAINDNGGLSGNIDADGNPIGTFEDDVRSYINTQLANDNGGDPSAPSAVDIAWWNTMRKGDDEITSFGAAPWIEMLYSNANQMNSDGDRVGELCEVDNDRDGIYTDNGTPIDACPTVYDPTNDAGKCAIDLAEYVLFKNMYTGQCMTHNQFAGATDSGTQVDFGSSTDGRVLGWANCDVNDLGQRFYVELSDSDAAHTNRFSFEERVIHIYTNEWKQTEPGFYDLVNMHYVASTIDNVTYPAAKPGSSSYWQYDDVITTTMAGYDGDWREWILSASDIESYPYLIESVRVWDVYGQADGLDPGRRDCIFEKGNSRPDADSGSCFPSDATSREKAAFKVLLGQNMVEWQGLFSTD